MKMFTISKLAREFGLSRSTLLYYDRIGLLSPSGRTASGYRCYTHREHSRLGRIRHLRRAGLTLAEIRSVLASGGKPGMKLLEKRIRQTTDDILDLRNQQRLLTAMLSRFAAGKRPVSLSKALWVEMLQIAGMNQAAMNCWHAEFERRTPDGHQEFLVSLGIPDAEIARIRERSRAAILERVQLPADRQAIF